MRSSAPPATWSADAGCRAGAGGRGAHPGALGVAPERRRTTYLTRSTASFRRRPRRPALLGYYTNNRLVTRLRSALLSPFQGVRAVRGIRVCVDHAPHGDVYNEWDRKYSGRPAVRARPWCTRLPRSTRIETVGGRSDRPPRRRDDPLCAEAYQRHHDSVRVFANRLVDDVAAAEDLVHEVFVPFARGAPIPQAGSPAESDRDAVNHARHHVRARSGAARRSTPRHQPVPTVVTPSASSRARQLSRAGGVRSTACRSTSAWRSCCARSRNARRGSRPDRGDQPDGNVRARLHHARRALRHCWRPAARRRPDMSANDPPTCWPRAAAA